MKVTCKFSLLIFCLSAAGIQAQTLIPRVGLSMATTTHPEQDTQDTDYGKELKPGILVGLAYEYVLSSKLSIQGELTYIQKGQIRSVSNPAYSLTDRYDFRLNYLELPILIKVTLGKGKVKFQPHIGASISYGISGTMKETFIDQNGSAVDHYNVKFEKWPPYKNAAPDTWYLGHALDYGVQAGFGVYLFNKFLVDARYSLGLRGLQFKRGDQLDRNMVFQFSVGMPIHLKGKGI